MNYQSETKSKKYIAARKKRALTIFSVFLILAGMFLFQIVNSNVQKSKINQEVVTEKKHYHKLSNENTQLKDRVKQMNDDDYLEKLVRYKYLYTKKGETVYNLPDDAN